MPFDLSDTQFTGPALPEPFVKFELENELTKLKLLSKTTGSEGKQLKDDWEAYRRHLSQLAVRGGPLRVRNQAIEPLCKRLGYTDEIESAPDVETREGREDGGYLLKSSAGAKLRVWTTDLDEDIDAPAKRGQAYRFSHLRIAQRVLLASGERVGLLTNGIELRLLISDPARPDSQVIFTLDPDWKRSREVPDSFRLLLALVCPAGVEKIPELVDKARLQQARVTKDLRDQARQAVQRFVQEVLDHPDNREWLSGQEDRAALARALWHEGLIIVYRLLFVLKLESSDDPARSFTFASTSLWRNTFSPSMALARYVQGVLFEGAETGGLLEQGLRGLFRMFHEGVQCTELNVKPLGGALFGAEATPVLSKLRWGERAVAHLLDQLLWTTPKKKGGTRERVHYGPLDVEDLGRVYEALLELEPGIAREPMCRLRRQKLEVVVPMAQGEKYRPAKPVLSDDDEQDVDEPEQEEEEDEDDAPKKGKKTTVQWIEEIQPERFYLRVGLGRKSTGSYYTPHSFVRFLVQETLGPQVAERSPHEDPQPGEILKLKVVDPACGSGHFLVESCRFLGQHLYEAVRLCDEKATAAERRAESAKRKEDRDAALAEAEKFRERVIKLPDPDGELLRYLPSRSVEGEQTGVSQRRAEAICRRMVAVHCLYAVDKNPLAVELAKLALWLESHAEGMPLTFLDHRIVVGDSLTGPFWEQMLSWPSKPKEKLKEGVYRHLETHLRAALFDALRHVRRLEATVGVSLAEVNDKAQAKAELDEALLPFRIAAAAWSGGVMLGPEHCDDAAYAGLLEHIGTTHELPDVIESEALCRMIVRGLGIDRSAGVPPALNSSTEAPLAQQKAAGTAALPPKGWHYRGYLPHLDAGSEVIQFVTFRLADSFPAARLQAWKDDLKLLSLSAANEEVRRRVEEYLDAGHGECLLRDPRLALLVQNALMFFHGQRYDMCAWVVMPNHVHALFRLRPGHALSDVVQSWKSYTAKEANRLLHRHGRFWQEDYFDRYVRDEDDFLARRAYVEENPVKAGLCQRAAEWPFGSAGVPPANDAPAPCPPPAAVIALPESHGPLSCRSGTDFTTARDHAGETPALRSADLCTLLASGRCAPALSFDLTFPEVFYPSGVPYSRLGFDAVIGNPPWDAIQFKSKEFFAAFDFEILNAPTKRERTAIEKRLTADPKCGPLFDWYKEDFEQQKRVNDCLYQYQKVFIQGDLAGRQLDAFRVFMERNSQLLRQQGITGVLVPSAFHANEGATGIRRLYLQEMTPQCCYSFENRRKLFEIDSRFRFALVVARRDATLTDFPCRFYLHDDEWLFGDRDGSLALRYKLDFIRRTGGEYLSLLELRSTVDLRVAETCFGNNDLLGAVCDSHRIRFGAECHMTNDAWRFAPTDEFCSPDEDPRDPDTLTGLVQRGLLLLHDDKTYVTYSDLTRKWRPRYLVPLDRLQDKLAWVSQVSLFRLSYRKITGATNYRTCIVHMIPPGSICGDAVYCERDALARPSSYGLIVLSIMAGFVFDWCVRLKTQTNLNLFIIHGCPFPYVEKSERFLAHGTLRLTCNHSGYAPLWREQVGEVWREEGKSRPGARASCPPSAQNVDCCTLVSPAEVETAHKAAETAALPPTWPVLAGDDERWAVRAAIDAVVADAYGLSRDQYAHVLSTFSHASYHKAPELCLARFDELKSLGLEKFTRKYDPYWDIPLNENLPQPVIDLPIPGEDMEADDGKYRLKEMPETKRPRKPRKGR